MKILNGRNTFKYALKSTLMKNTSGESKIATNDYNIISRELLILLPAGNKMDW